MAIRIVRLGTPRAANEGPRLGTVRRPPRGVAKSEFATRDFYDVWLPELAPSARLLATTSGAEPWTDRAWRQFARAYQREMRQPAVQHVIATLAALSQHTNFAVGCYCADETRCHRTVLAELMRKVGAVMSETVQPNFSHEK